MKHATNTKWGWSKIAGIVDVQRRRESDGAKWYLPTIRNGFTINGSGVVTNPIEYAPVLPKNHPLKLVEIKIANPAPDCWGVGFGLEEKPTSGHYWGCGGHPVYPTGIMALAQTLTRQRKAYPGLAGIEFGPIMIEALLRDLERPDVEVV